MTSQPTETKGWIGRPIPRVEDRRLVTGQGRFTDDIASAGHLFASFVRSPYPHAAIGHIDIAGALSMPGVETVLTGRDYRADGLHPIAHRANPAGAVDHRVRAFDPDRSIDLPHWPLAEDRARHLGEPVAVVVADTASRARDAAEAVAVDFTPMDAVTHPDSALGADAPIVHGEVPGNLAVDELLGTPELVEEQFTAAAATVRLHSAHGRIVNCQMEPRAVIADPTGPDNVLTITAGSQGVMRIRDGLCQTLGIDPASLRVICPDVGGGFGPRSFLYPEIVVLAWAARRLGRPVRWTADRSESFLTDFQGRDTHIDAALALDGSGRFLALDIDILSNIGAHTVAFVPLANASRIVSTVYDIPAVRVRARGVLTHTVPTAPYRGAGRPEAHAALERLIDEAARRLGLDRVDLRRRNLIPKARLPHRTAMGLIYDSGDFGANMERALALADWQGAGARKQAAAGRGRLHGIGVANYIESPVGDPRERIEIAIGEDGRATIVTGTQSTGQGHETTFAQVAADMLGIPMESVRLISGDSGLIRMGGGTHSDRSMRIAGALIAETADKIVSAGIEACSVLWDTSPADIAFDGGLFRQRRTNRAISLADLAGRLAEEGERPLSAASEFIGRMPAHPTGCAICELEIDRETGHVDITRYATVDDAGRVINPLIVDGQVHGGIVQGVGETLTERLAYDPETGQLLTGSLLDYALPRADNVPSFTVELAEHPTSGNRLGVKGGGEAGITPAAAAISNAIADALGGHSDHLAALPVTADRIWHAIREAGL